MINIENLDTTRHLIKDTLEKKATLPINDGLGLLGGPATNGRNNNFKKMNSDVEPYSDVGWKHQYSFESSKVQF